MLKINPRRLYDDLIPDGYQESDRDFLENNLESAVWLLENFNPIIAVAARICDNGLIISLPPPHRHHHVIQMFNMMFPDCKSRPRIEQGFLDNLSRFLTREEAAIAVGRTAKLYSEDLW